MLPQFPHNSYYLFCWASCCHVIQAILESKWKNSDLQHVSVLDVTREVACAKFTI